MSLPENWMTSWTKDDVRILKEMRHAKIPAGQIAARLGRTVGSVRTKLYMIFTKNTSGDEAHHPAARDGSQPLYPR